MHVDDLDHVAAEDCEMALIQRLHPRFSAPSGREFPVTPGPPKTSVAAELPAYRATPRLTTSPRCFHES
jgi:hypothetical protein